MAIGDTDVELEFTNIVANVPLVVGIQNTGVSAEVFVRFSTLRTPAVLGLDYSLIFPVDLLTFTITPTLSLVNKIAAAGQGNVIYVQRVLPLTSDFDYDNAFVRAKLVDEFNRMWMVHQQFDYRLDSLQDANDAADSAADSAADAAASAAAADAAADAATAAAAAAVTSAEGIPTNINQFGAVGDGVTNDTAAVTTALGNGSGVYVDGGNYKTTFANFNWPAGKLWGQGSILTNSPPNKWAPWYSSITVRPSSTVVGSSVANGFSGDISKVQIAMQHTVSGAATLGQPATGYMYTDETAARLAWMSNTSGWNQQLNTNDGRTSALFERVHLHQGGQGDMMAYEVSGVVASTLPGSTHWLANPAVSAFVADMYAGVDGAFLNPVEIDTRDGGFDAASVTFVGNMIRDNNTGAKNGYWACLRGQSVGSAPVDDFAVASGKYDRGLTFAYANFGVNQAAIVMSVNQRIYGNAVGGSNFCRLSSLGTEFIGYASGTGAWIIANANNPALQVYSNQVLSPYRMITQEFFQLGDGVTAPVAAAGYAKLYVDNADGDLKVRFGDGVIQTLAEDTAVPARTRFWSNIDNGAAITIPRVLLHRERIYVGAAVDASSYASNTNPTFGWLTQATGPNWIPRDSSINVVAEDGNVAVFGGSRASDNLLAGGGAAIGVAGFAMVDKAGAGGWAGYFEAIRNNATARGQGIELDVRNCATGTVADNPYATGLGPHALWIACGPGDVTASNGYGPAPIADSGAAMVVLCNTDGGNTFKFSKGIVFRNDGLSGVTGADAEVTGGVSAMEMGRGQAVRWYATGGLPKLSIYSLFNAADVNWNMYGSGTGLIFARNNNAENVLVLAGMAGGVNYFQLQNQTTGTPPQFLSLGADTDIDISFNPKGAGIVRSPSPIKTMIGTAIPAGGTAGKGFMLSSVANFGVFFGSGLPTLSAAKGSLYLRSDGTTTNDRMYVNTNGSTTWTAVNTVA